MGIHIYPRYDLLFLPTMLLPGSPVVGLENACSPCGTPCSSVSDQGTPFTMRSVVVLLCSQDSLGLFCPPLTWIYWAVARVEAKRCVSKKSKAYVGGEGSYEILYVLWTVDQPAACVLPQLECACLGAKRGRRVFAPRFLIIIIPYGVLAKIRSTCLQLRALLV